MLITQCLLVKVFWGAPADLSLNWKPIRLLLVVTLADYDSVAVLINDRLLLLSHGDIATNVHLISWRMEGIDSIELHAQLTISCLFTPNCTRMHHQFIRAIQSIPNSNCSEDVKC